jgi:hypothetical protein
LNYPQAPGPYPPNWQPQQGQPYPPYPQAPQPYPQQYGQGPGTYYPPQQWAGAQLYGPQGYGQPAEGIDVTTRYSPLMFTLALLFKPKIVVDGYETPSVGWGRTVLPARPGRHRVHVRVPYLLPRRIGPADTVAEVYPGRLVELEYKAPVFALSPGSLGRPPQSYNGVGIAIAVLAVFLVFAVMFLPIIAMLASR